MKAVILAGGFGSRISEESILKPKPMIEIGDRPILWHIMKSYSSHGFNEFIICCGYKQHLIKKYFANYYLHNSDVTFDLLNNSMEIHCNTSEPWKITLVDTGINTMTGGRVKRIQPYVQNETFMLTYGDVLSDVDIRAVFDFHESHGKIGTITAIRPDSCFGALEISGDSITSFREKNKEDAGYINGGFMVFQSEIFDYIKDDATIFERESLEKLCTDGELMAYKHDGFWQCMDTKRDKDLLEKLWTTGQTPWRKC